MRFLKRVSYRSDGVLENSRRIDSGVARARGARLSPLPLVAATSLRSSLRCGAYFVVLRPDGGPFQSTQTAPPQPPHLVLPSLLPPLASLVPVVPRAGAPQRQADQSLSVHTCPTRKVPAPSKQFPGVLVSNASEGSSERALTGTERASALGEGWGRKH
ncbi:hypothetical protein [Haladaptatus sp. NG-SE-30]